MSVPARVAVRHTSTRVAAPAHPIAIALLGYGTIGAAVARSAAEWSTPERPLEIVGALVRDRARSDRARAGVALVGDAHLLFERRPDVIVEALGGVSPARALVRSALERGIPVVTANKALIARYGDELLAVAVRNSVALRYEASVLAGVPFLGTFAARPYAARVSRVTGIVNGTSNFVLSRMAEGATSLEEVVADAQRRGYAEPDPSEDLDGIDAVHKLAVLTRHFGLGSLPVDRIERIGIRGLVLADFIAARELGGTIKPIAAAWRAGGRVEAFAGPAFVPRTHKLASIDGVENALALDAASGSLFLSGPGAGPAPTATTILDDVIEAATGRDTCTPTFTAAVVPSTPSTPWFVRLVATGSARQHEAAKHLGWYGVWPRNTAVRQRTSWFLTYECTRDRVERALAALESLGIQGTAFRALNE